MLPKGALTDGTIAAIAGLVLFALPDGTGRPMLVWPEANRAPWDVVLMFGGGLAMAMGMTESGLTVWLGKMLLPLPVPHTGALKATKFRTPPRPTPTMTATRRHGARCRPG